MTNNDALEFGKIMAAIVSAFNEQMNEKRVEVYFQALQRFEIGEIKLAANKLLDTCKFFPKIAEIVEVIEGQVEDRASQAWYNYLKALDKPGPYKTLGIGDPFAHAAIEDMDLWGEGIERNGYPDNRSDVDFIRQEFIRRYKVHAKHSNPANLPSVLPGIFETVNHKKISAGEHQNWTPSQLGYVMEKHPALAPVMRKELEARRALEAQNHEPEIQQEDTLASTSDPAREQ